MVRRLVAYLPLMGAMLLASPADAHACDEWLLLESPPATWAPSLPMDEHPVLWCERSDDPRCVPGSRGADAPELSSRFTLRPQIPELPGAPVHAARFASGSLLGPRSGFHPRIPRPPRP